MRMPGTSRRQPHSPSRRYWPASWKRHFPIHHPNCRPTKPRRSEEHTSELQSPCNLVCRLLLEKKKKFYLSSSLPYCSLYLSEVYFAPFLRSTHYARQPAHPPALSCRQIDITQSSLLVDPPRC